MINHLNMNKIHPLFNPNLTKELELDSFLINELNIKKCTHDIIVMGRCAICLKEEKELKAP